MTGANLKTGEANLEKGFRLPWAVLFVLVYFALQIILVTLVSNGAGVDDAEQLANIGYLDWGYGGSQPPLYTWFTNFAAAILGTKLLTLQIVKFSLLASLFVSIYGGMRLLGFSSLIASAAMLGTFLIPQISWESQRALTHSVAGTTACAWAFCAFAWYMRRQSILPAIVLGITMAAALLGKFNASFFLIMLVTAGLLVGEYRQILLSRRSLWTLFSFVACLTPTMTWMLRHRDSVLARSNKLQMGASGSPFADRLHGVENFIEAAFLFSVLALAIAGIVSLLHFRNRNWPDTPLSAGERFMRWLLVSGVLIVFLGVVITGANEVKDRWLQPVLFLLPAVLVCLLARYRGQTRALRDFAVVSACIALLVPPVLGYYLVYGSKSPPLGQLDYKTFYTQLSDQGQFTSILTDNVQVPGNFRLFDPNLQVIHPESPDGIARLSRPALVLWFSTNGEANPAIANLMQQAGITPPAGGVKTGDIPFLHQTGKYLTMSYFLAQ